jgi:hypothetical protein
LLPARVVLPPLLRVQPVVLAFTFDSPALVADGLTIGPTYGSDRIDAGLSVGVVADGFGKCLWLLRGRRLCSLGVGRGAAVGRPVTGLRRQLVTFCDDSLEAFEPRQPLAG